MTDVRAYIAHCKNASWKPDLVPFPRHQAFAHDEH